MAGFSGNRRSPGLRSATPEGDRAVPRARPDRLPTVGNAALQRDARLPPLSATAMGNHALQMLQDHATGLDGTEIHRRARLGVSSPVVGVPHRDALQPAFPDLDLDTVRAHLDPRATRSIGAVAYTLGDDVVVGNSPGPATVAHELAHVAQQRRGEAPANGLGTVHDPQEAQADARADVATRTHPASTPQRPQGPRSGASGAAAVQRQEPTSGDPALPAGPLDRDALRAAVAYNTRLEQSNPAEWDQISRLVGAPRDTTDIVTIAQKIAEWQAGARADRATALPVDGCCTAVTLHWMSLAPGGKGIEKAILPGDHTLAYVGLNAMGDQSQRELDDLKANRNAGNVEGVATRVTETPEGELHLEGQIKKGEEEPFVQSLGLDKKTADALVAYLKGLDARSLQGVSSLARMLARAETGAILMKRLVISGHHNVRKTVGRFYGVGSIHVDNIEALAPIFPVAFGQVEDILLSACNTGHFDQNTGKGRASTRPNAQILDRISRCFPNLQTAWAYTTTAPSDQAALRDNKKWAEASRTGDTTSIQQASRAQQDDPLSDMMSIVWSRNPQDEFTPQGR